MGTPPPLTLRRRLILFLTSKEIIVVVFILGCMLQLILVFSRPVKYSTWRSRTTTEIAALATALENYKIDNGAYPVSLSSDPGATPIAMPSALTEGDPATYMEGAQLLFRSLSARPNFSAAPVIGIKYYFPFKRNEVGGLLDSAAIDAWGNPYGYNARKPDYNPGGFDLWSTANGKSISQRRQWIANFELK